MPKQERSAPYPSLKLSDKILLIKDPRRVGGGDRVEGRNLYEL